MAPQLIYGGASLAMDMTEYQDAASVSSLLHTLHDLGISRIDTAARYPPLQPGRSEALLGETIEQSAGFTVDTKIYTDTSKDGSGDLAGPAIDKSAGESLVRLSRPSGVNILHCHRADPSTPLEEQVRAFNQQIRDGRCKAWGVSNVPIDALEEMLRICDTQGLIKPVCYQGEYNLVTRGMETKLLPLLRAHGLYFNAFRPLAAGFLSGKFASDQKQQEGSRWDDSNPLSAAFKQIYGAPDLANAMRTFEAACRKHDATTLEVGVRWIVHHSALKEGDGVILGASKTYQIVDTVGKINKGPLPPDVLEAAEEVWESIRETREDVL